MKHTIEIKYKGLRARVVLTWTSSPLEDTHATYEGHAGLIAAFKEVLDRLPGYYIGSEGLTNSMAYTNSAQYMSAFYDGLKYKVTPAIDLTPFTPPTDPETVY